MFSYRSVHVFPSVSDEGSLMRVTFVCKNSRIALKMSGMGSLPWHDSQTVSVIGWPFPQFLYHLYPVYLGGRKKIVVPRFRRWVGVPVAPFEVLPG